MMKSNTQHRWLRPVIEYGPIAAFLAAYYFADLFAATAAIMIASLLVLILSYIIERKIPMIPLVTAGIVGVFGGLTLWLQDETFIKMKPTLIQICFGAILLGGLLKNRLFLKSLLEKAFNLTDQGWRVLTIRMSIFFFLSAVLNEYIWRTQSTELWVNFKVFGLTGLTFVFFMTQIPVLKRFALEDNDETTS